MGAKAKNEEKTIVSDIIVAQEELKALKAEQGIKDEERGISRMISKFFDYREAQAQIPINKKKYLLLAVFFGWMGAHRFYAKQYPTAVLYLLLCWSGFPFAMTLVDLLIAIPKKPDEKGDIYF